MGCVSKIAQPQSAPARPPVGVIDRPQVDAELEAWRDSDSTNFVCNGAIDGAGSRRPIFLARCFFG